MKLIFLHKTGSPVWFSVEQMISERDKLGEPCYPPISSSQCLLGHPLAENVLSRQLTLLTNLLSPGRLTRIPDGRLSTITGCPEQGFTNAAVQYAPPLVTFSDGNFPCMRPFRGRYCRFTLKQQRILMHDVVYTFGIDNGYIVSF